MKTKNTEKDFLKQRRGSLYSTNKMNPFGNQKGENQKGYSTAQAKRLLKITFHNLLWGHKYISTTFNKEWLISPLWIWRSYTSNKKFSFKVI